MHLPQLIHDLAVILVVASVVSFIFQKIKQPVVLGYILAGIIVGPHTPPYAFVLDLPSIRVWGDIGVIFLMFSLGLEFSFRRLARVGLPAALTAALEMSFMMFLGFLIGKAMGWSSRSSVFLGAMICISSTTIIIKALDEMKLKTRRFAESIMGILVVEDLFAILILVGLTLGSARGEISGLTLLTAAGQLMLIVSSWFIVGYFAVPWLMAHATRIGTDETLVIVSAGFCFLLVAFAAYFNYSPALGAFIMGSILAETSASEEIEKLIRPLRDLFAAVFFVSVGLMFDPAVFVAHGFVILLLVVVVIVGKTTGVTVGQVLTGQRFRTAVQVGMGLAQIGEFSFIIAGLGLSLGVLTPELYSLIVAVSVVTTFTTPYTIRWSHECAIYAENRLPIRLKLILSRYTVFWEQIGREYENRELVLRAILKWFVNATLVTVVTILVSELLLPRLGHDLQWLGWLIVIVTSAPFVWGMLTSFTHLAPSGFTATVFISRVAAVAWVGLLSLEFFSFQYAILGSLGGVLLFTLLFYRRLDEFYKWFEVRFLKTFEDPAQSAEASDMAQTLAPWDAHLIRITVHPNAEIVGQTLQDIQLRNIYGVSVVAIRRGYEDVVAPLPTFQVFPQDELVVLGSEDEVEACRSIIEKAQPIGFTSRPNFELRSIVISRRSKYVGQTIREARFRDDFQAMVVGIQRGKTRLVSPDSDLQILKDDVIWLVGATQRLDSLFKRLKLI